MFLGACKILEDFIGHTTMWLPCMPHILELVFGAIIIKDRWSSTGPYYSLFAKFKAAWSKIYEKLPHVLEPHDVRLKEICPDDVFI